MKMDALRYVVLSKSTVYWQSWIRGEVNPNLGIDSVSTELLVFSTNF